MNIEDIENEFLRYIDEQNGVCGTFGKMEFTKSDRIGQGGNGLERI